MSSKFKIDGIYNVSVINTLKKLSIYNFGFDFRPLSFNFIPQYSFEELVSESFESRCKYYLHFDDEKEFMIWKIVDDLTKLYSKISKNISDQEYLTMQNNFFMEFSYLDHDIEFYNQFNLPFYIHINKETELDKFLSRSFLKGIIIDYEELNVLHEQDLLLDFINKFSNYLKMNPRHRHLDIVLNIDWDSDIFPTLPELVNFSIVSLQINKKIESSYRNVDSKKVISSLKTIRQFI